MFKAALGTVHGEHSSPCLMQSHCKVAKITLDLSEFKVTNTALRFLSVYEYLPKSFLLFFKQLR